MVKCLRQSIQEFLKTRLDLSMRSKSNRSLSLLVFDKRRKPKYPEKKPLGASERTNNKLKTNIWRRRWDLNPGHIDGSECLHHCATLAWPRIGPPLSLLLFPVGWLHWWELIASSLRHSFSPLSDYAPTALPWEASALTPAPLLLPLIRLCRSPTTPFPTALSSRMDF